MLFLVMSLTPHAYLQYMYVETGYEVKHTNRLPGIRLSQPNEKCDPVGTFSISECCSFTLTKWAGWGLGVHFLNEFCRYKLYSKKLFRPQ